MIEGKKILILGVGSIGGELLKQVVSNNETFIVDLEESRMFDFLEEYRLDGHKIRGQVGDIRDKEFLERIFESFMPDIVFNASARKHVAPMEDTPMEAVSVNIMGTWNIIHLCRKFRVDKFISISTDKVVHADCVMGATKKVAEIMVRNAGYSSVRFGNVMGSNGSLLSIINRRISQGKSVPITDERMERFMMTIPEAVGLILKAAMDEDNAGVYILDMGKPIKIIELAHRIVAEIKRENGKDVPIEIIGMKPGEKLSEKLMTEDEEAQAIKKDNYWILYAKGKDKEKL